MCKFCPCICHLIEFKPDTGLSPTRLSLALALALGLGLGLALALGLALLV